MSKETVKYKRTLRGSVGAGMSALFNGNGRRFVIIEHKNASKYHKAGESQKIIVDEAELGRNPNCTVRFDESFETVSRRHAAIVREGEGWKIIPLSSNPTYVNGRKIDTEWHLHNGDEIQLATNGPKMGFIVPEGKQSLVSSIKMTERLELFRKQALKPYKTAIAASFALLILVSCGVGYVIHNHDLRIKAQDINIKEIIVQNNLQDSIIVAAKNEMATRQDSLNEVNKRYRNQVSVDPTTVVAKALDAVKGSVYAVITSVYIEDENEKQLLGTSQGSGFLLDDGRFVTARHCVEPWMFDMGQMQAMYALAKTGLFKIHSHINAINKNGETLTFNNDNFKINRSYDSPVKVQYELLGETVMLDGDIACGTTASLGNDWAYVNTGKKGAIKDGKQLSETLKSSRQLHLLGFPQSLGIGDGDHIVDPIYNVLAVSRDGLNDSRCIMVNQGVDHGNSGGPVFAMDKNKLMVIGIVSRGDMNSDLYNHLVPMANLK